MSLCVPAGISVGAKSGTGDNCLSSLTPWTRPQACNIHVNVGHQSIWVRSGGCNSGFAEDASLLGCDAVSLGVYRHLQRLM